MTRSTLASPARFKLIVRKSLFIADAGPIDSADQALALLASLRSSDASHHCWAYRIGDAYRSFDDGEPSGTAGRPILAAIDGQRCDRVMVVVARWFGGIKLGAGGLVRAYGGAACECLRTATRVPIVELARLTITCGFEHIGTLHQLVAHFGVTRHAERFTDQALSIDTELPRERLQALQNALRDATRGQVRFAEATE